MPDKSPERHSVKQNPNFRFLLKEQSLILFRVYIWANFHTSVHNFPRLVSLLFFPEVFILKKGKFVRRASLVTLGELLFFFFQDQDNSEPDSTLVK